MFPKSDPPLEPHSFRPIVPFPDLLALLRQEKAIRELTQSKGLGKNGEPEPNRFAFRVPLCYLFSHPMTAKVHFLSLWFNAQDPV